MVETELQQRHSGFDVSANNLLEARSKARISRNNTKQLLSLYAIPDGLEAQKIVMDEIPKELELILRKWERNIDKVDMLVEGEIVDTLSLVQSLSSKNMDNVTIEPAKISGQYNIKLTFRQEGVEFKGGRQ